jgi:NitT/TauT family transport system permease protein
MSATTDTRATAQTPAEEAAPRRSFYAQHETTIIGTISVVAFLFFWEYAVTQKWVNALFTSSPLRIINAGAAMVKEGTIWQDLATSGLEFGLGFGLATVIGVPLGILMGWYRRFNAVLEPFVNALYATPRIALLPLIVIWFGIDLGSKVAIVFLSTVFPILVNTMVGIRTVDRDFVKVARSFGASDRQLFMTVALPSSVPFLLTGLRLGLGHALIGIVVGEMYGATSGIGYMMAVAGSTFQTDRVMVGIIIIAASGMIMTQMLKMIEMRFEKWRVDSRG